MELTETRDRVDSTHHANDLYGGGGHADAQETRRWGKWTHVFERTLASFNRHCPQGQLEMLNDQFGRRSYCSIGLVASLAADQ